MSHYQQQYYPPTAPSTSGGAPVSSFYSARQRFEQASQPTTSVPPHLRSNAYDYRQHVAPPKHPVQQARSVATQNQYPGHPGPSQHARPQSQYGQVQHPYQAPYAGQRIPGPAQVHPQAQAPVQPVQAPPPSQYAASTRPRSEYNPSLYAQSMQGYSPFPMMSGSQPTPARAFALYEAYNARQQQREAAAAVATQRSQSQDLPQQYSQFQPQHQPQTSYQPPPQPQPPRQPQQYPTQQHQPSHVPSYAYSIPQTGPSMAPQQAVPAQVSPSFLSSRSPAHAPNTIPAPVGPIPQPQPQPGSQAYNQSQQRSNVPQRTPTVGTRRPLPQPRPRPMSMPPQMHTQSPPSSVTNILPQSSERPVTIIHYPSPPSEKPPALPNPPSILLSAFPVSPFSKFSIPEKMQSETAQTPGQEQVPPYTEKELDTTPTRRRVLPQSPATPPDLSHPEKRNSVLNTVSSALQVAKPTSSQPGSPRVSLEASISEVAANSETQDDDDRLSVKSRESKQSGQRTPSPQYGILDLPKRNPSVFGGGAKSETASPKYGIKDLPTRTKSVVDRRKAWERVEQGMNETVAHTQSSSKSASSRKSAVPKPSISAPPSTIPAPSRSPQPQVPQQQQKLPMPAVQQPQPSRTERTPSWTLPTADLEKLAAASGPKTSMALRMAKMSLEEEKAKSKKAASQPIMASPAQPQRSSVQSGSSKARSTSPTKSYPFASRIPRRSSTINLNLDDAPPPSLRRTPSPSTSASSSSVPSIPSIKTPEDVPQILAPSIPQINLPGGLDFDDVVTKPASPQKPNVPVINLPDDDGSIHSGPIISVSAPSPNMRSGAVVMPVILDDLASSAGIPKSRGLPRPPSSSSSSATAISNSGSNLHSRGGGLVCGGCGRSIIGRIVSAMGLRWHPQCFKCRQCGEQLEHVSSYEHGGKPYCHLDYHELFAPQCYSCKTPIIDERFITLDDPVLGKRTYHEQHFFCAECGDPFLAPSNKPSGRTGPNEISIKGDGAFDVAVDEDGLEVGFTVFKGHPYCETCHVRLRAPKCKACKRSIRDGMRAVEALGGKWCFECFVCAGCQKPFEEPSFFQRDKKPFCEHCFSIILRNEI